MTERERLHSLTLNRRRFLIGSAAAAASAVLAACGGSSTAPTATTGAAAAATKPAGAAAASGSTPAAAGTPAAAASTPAAAAQTTGGASPTFGAVSTVGVQVKTSIQNPAPGKPQGNKPSELILCWGTDQLTTHAIDPQTHVATIAESILRHVYEPLVKVERDGKTISPLLATAWKRLDDNTMQFTLRQNITFHNGEPFNADSVKYSIMRPLDPKNNADARSTYTVIDRVDVVDPYTVNVHTAKPDPALLSRMTGFSMCQVAPKWTEANALPGGVLKTANGTGPYKFVSWSPNQDFVVASNEQYWGGAPQIKNVRMKIIGEQATRVAALRSGEVHVAKDMPPEEVDGMNKSGRQTARAVASNRVPVLHLRGAQAAAGQCEVAPGGQLRGGLGRDHPGCPARQRQPDRDGAPAVDRRLQTRRSSRITYDPGQGEIPDEGRRFRQRIRHEHLVSCRAGT